MTPTHYAFAALVALWLCVAANLAWSQDSRPAVTERVSVSADKGGRAPEAKQALRGTRGAIPAHPELYQAHELARVSYLEATWRRSDMAAIWWMALKRVPVLQRATGRPVRPVQALHALSSAYRVRRTERAKEAARLPWWHDPDRSDGWNARWRKHCAYAMQVVRGLVSDPCPSAIVWGGVGDKPKGRAVLATCAAQHQTANRLYALGD